MLFRVPKGSPTPKIVVDIKVRATVLQGVFRVPALSGVDGQGFYRERRFTEGTLVEGHDLWRLRVLRWLL